MIQAKLIDEKDDLGNQLQKDNSLHIFDNVESIINNKGKFDWNIVNLLTVYDNMRIIVISRNEVKFDNIEAIKHLLMIKQLSPLTDEEAVDLIHSNCERQIMDDLAAHNFENVHMMEGGGSNERKGGRRRESVLRPRGNASQQ